jgi:glycosyltransferase involved in cell wall biosynthesis
LKVFQILNNFLPYQTAGTEVYTWALSKQLQSLGVDVSIVIPNYGSNSFSCYQYDGLKVYKYEEPTDVDRALIMGKKNPIGLKFFENYLKSERPDIVHFHEIAGSNGVTVNHVVAAKNLGIKVVFTFHLASNTCKTGTLIQNGEKKCDGKLEIEKCNICYLTTKPKLFLLNAFSNFFYKCNIDTTNWNNKLGTALGSNFVIKKLEQNFFALVSSCDVLIAITKWYKDILLLNSVPEEKIAFIPQALPHFVDEANTLSKMHAPPRQLKLVFLGRISQFKGLHILIEAIIALPKDQVTLDIFGQSDNTDYEAKLKNKTANSYHIKWMGKMQQHEVVEKLSSYDILCLCSTFSEMSPLVIQEAFAAKIPVLASNVYGNAEQIKDGENGWLFKFNDSKDLELKLEMLIKNPSFVLSAKNNIKKVKSFKDVAAEQLVVYKQLLN